MARVNLFNFTNSISNESVDETDDKNVALDATIDLPEQVKEDTDAIKVDEPIDVETSNTKTSEPGPEDGGGTGKADFQVVDKAKVNMKVSDVAKNIERDQNGGRHIDTLPSQVKASDGLSDTDISTSVEDHDESSELETIDASGAEEIETADEMIVDLEGSELEVVGITDTADKGISDAEDALAKVNELNEAAASVERYLGLLNRIDETGGTMSPELRQSISWALESIDPELFFEERVALESFDPSAKVSLEASAMTTTDGRVYEGEIADGEDPGEVSKGISAKLKKIVEAGIRMFWRAVNAVVDAYNALTSNMPKIRDHLTELRKKVNSLEGGVEFQMKGAHRLMIGDEFVGDSRQAIHKVSTAANELLVKWPNQLAKIIKDWSDGRSKGDSTGHEDTDNLSKLISNIANLLDTAFHDFKSLNSGDRDKVPSGFLNVNRINWSGPLPGNRAIYTGVNDSGTITNHILIKKSIVINFSAIPGEDTHSGPVTLTTPTAGEAIAIIRELEKLTYFVDDAKNGMAVIKKMATTAFGESLEDMISSKSLTEHKLASATIITGVSIATTETQNQFFGYLTAMIKAYISYLHACLNVDGNDVIEGNVIKTIEGNSTRVD